MNPREIPGHFLNKQNMHIGDFGMIGFIKPQIMVAKHFLLALLKKLDDQYQEALISSVNN
jgi:hypothetical protein